MDVRGLQQVQQSGICPFDVRTGDEAFFQQGSGEVTVRTKNELLKGHGLTGSMSRVYGFENTNRGMPF
jgi:hypothetical protein